MIQRDHLARQTGHDADLQREILTLFVEQMRDLDKMLEAGLLADGKAGSQGQVTGELLHRYRGAAAAVGATEVAGELARAERNLAVARLSAGELQRLRASVAATVEDALRIIAGSSQRGLAKGGESH